MLSCLRWLVVGIVANQHFFISRAVNGRRGNFGVKIFGGGI
ncbi:MAG: hypothetical protein Rpha_1763 [Candidatus Ruthia sp. Apha_13_S6]|nr:hypothetical protein [Candidatus Ruthia sp. Apha_13_S6]